VTTLQAFAARLAQERRQKAARDRRDIGQKDVAKAVKTTPASVSRWESGLNMPDDDTVIRLAAYFGVTPSWLRYGQAPREAEPERVDVPIGVPFEPQEGAQAHSRRAQHRRRT